MIFLVHEKAYHVVQVWRNSQEVPLAANLCSTFWQLAEKFPDELLVWVEKEYYPILQKNKLGERFTHELVMSSYAVKRKFLPESIGYVDQLPFITVNPGVLYPSWRMSSDLGGIYGKTLLKFKKTFRKISDFDYLLNSVAKVGQQNGLFCYSDPGLMDSGRKNVPVARAESKELFSFVYQHYKTLWVFVLFFCYVKYEKRFPLVAFLQSFLKPKFFKKDVDLSDIEIAPESSEGEYKSSIDVIIPTLGRADYVRQVVVDLSFQILLPKRVIIVEQQPDKKLKSELQDLLGKKWPFGIVHIFTRKTGACMARNKGLEKVESEWVFFADDDIRLGKEILANTLKESDRLGIDCINLNCKQPGEKTIFHKVKQWGSFGSGTSVVRSRFAKDLRFSEVFEHGYGEDADFGMQLREKGCDIIYHPELEIQHLKAPVGGFRKKPILAWEKESPKPKPSPTVMILAKRYYTPTQMKGFKISLYLKYFRKQENKNPFTYFKRMERSWERSEEWAQRLEARILTSKTTCPKEREE